jgi:hypothetical protein
MRKFLFLSFMLMLTGLTSWAQRTVTGRVTDANGAPIPNASVVIQNTRTGTVTKEDGSFSISVPANGRTLIISAVGMASQDLVIGTQSSLTVALKVGTQQNMEEVVVTALGIRRSEKALGYAVSKVDPNTVLQKSEPDFLKDYKERFRG